MKSRPWFLISLLLLVAAALCWRQGERLRQREQPGDAATNATARPTVWERFTRLPYVLTGRPVPRPSAATAAKPPELLSLSRDPRLPFRLRNSDRREAELFRSETAVLLRNALVETTEPLDLRIPEHLRAAEEPGSWLVQARGTIDQKFRDVLRGAGAEIVSYVPNNAYLVRGSANLAHQLRVSPRVQSVLPFEPYYKLDMTLLPLAVRRDPMPVGRWLNVVLFAGTLDQAKADLRALGAEVKSEQRFPFGHVVTIAPPADSLVALARMPAVQNIEVWHSPVLANDLSRVRLDVSTSTTASAPGGNWLNLTGNGVFVGLIDSGVDLAHGQLAGRTFTNAASPGIDVDGHGTHVAGVIAANDAADPGAASGSLVGATYRGIAPGARVYPLSLYSTDYTNYANPWLITNAALATNIFIVNNSWGYPVTAYDINSALFDEAVRDSVPFRTNDQPVTHVFAVGNSGGANSGGTGGNADSINSPGNGKNVLSIGATEQFRLVSNSVVSTNFGTNDPIATAHSDSADQVADFSGRGNVGVGVEGPSGRMKPDLVAPGDYVVSLRASTFTNVQESDLTLGSAWRYERGTSVAAGKVSGLLALVQEFFSMNFGRPSGLKPSLNKALLINRARSLNGVYDFAVNGSVTHQGWGFPSLSNTLPAVASISFLTSTSALPVVNRIVLLEESALVTNHLASGQFHAYDVSVPAVTGLTNNLKITLAWTDPAGNPISSTKLVNDLDLYVTNIVANGRQFEGNNFAPGSTVTQPTVPGTPSARDSVNNVENAYIPLTNAAASTFRVYVIGRKVNVNAVTANTNQIAQDYSVVFSTDAAISLTVRPTAGAGFSAYTNRPISIVTNGIPKLDERVGANSPLWTVNGTANANTNGVTNQWNFYVFTNQNYATSTTTNFVTNIVAGSTNVVTNVVRLPLTNSGPYVGFATFLPPNLARARNAEADVDMFVTRSSLAYPGLNGAGGITNLDPAVLASANVSRSTNRGGYELITFSNSVVNERFYVGIKSEDQQGGAYGFFGAASQSPFGTNTTNGGIIITLFPAPMDIPDGSPDTPGGVVLYGICATNIVMQSISNYITYVHENLGDLVGTLTHNGTVITLNNHSVTPTGPFPGGAGLLTNALTYDDFRNPPDGPGDVTDLVGQDGIGLWIFEVYDNSPLLTGRVDNASIYMMPYTNQYSPTNGIYIRTVTLQAGQSFVDFLDVPVTATNLDVDIVGGIASVPGPASPGTGVDLMAGVPGLIPTSSNYSIGTFDLDSTDQTSFPHLRISAVSVSNLVSGAPAPLGTPPLIPGRWNFRVLNNSPGTLTLTLRYTLGLNLSVADNQLTYTNALVSLLDNYTTNLYLNIAADRVIAGVDVGMSILHPRVSDLVIHLVAPSGRKVLLFEDRGGINGVTTPNLRANFTENTNYVTHIDTNGLTAGGFQNLGMLRPIKFIPAPYSAVVSPPTLVTNITNLLFGFPGAVGAPGAFQESPGGLAHHGNSLFMPGKVNRNGTNDAFIVAYHTPITNKAPTVVNYNANFAINTIYDTVTNWAVSNIWPGSLSGYRGGDPAIPAVSRTPEQTFFNGVAANSDGVFAVGQTRNYFPPTTLIWSGTNTRQVYDIDLGAKAGSVRLDHVTDAIHDRILVQYEGRDLLDYTPAGATPLREVNTLTFNGASHFLRVVMNPVVNAPAGSSWMNTITIFRSNDVTFAVNDLVGNVSFNVLPPTVAPLPGTLDGPEAVALDATNQIYVADSLNNRIVKFSQVVPLPSISSHNGTYVPLTLGAAGHPAPGDQLRGPKGVAVRANGEIFVADTVNNLIKRFNTNNAWLESWGDTAGFSAGNENSGVGGFTRGRFNGPQGIYLGTNDILYVADTGNNLIRTIDLASGLVGTVALPAAFVTTDGNLNKPRGVVVVHGTAGGNDVTQLARLGSSVISDVNLYVTDTDNNRIVWLQQAAPATWNAFHLAGGAFPTFTSGRVDNQNAVARFDKPSGITADGSGNLYVTDAGSHLVRRVTPLGDVQTIAGDYTGGTTGNVNDDVGGSARFDTPRGLAADRFGTLFVADSINDRVRIVTPYQSRTPTNAFVAYFPFNGPTNPVMGASPVFFSRGITNSVFGLELGGADSRDYFSGVATSAESGPNGTTTNFLYAVGAAQFSRNDSTVPPLAAYNRMFLTKFATNGQPIWTRGHMPVAVMHPVLNGVNDITSLVLDYGGAGYGSVPAVTILDPTNPNPAKRSISVTVTVTGGVVDPPPPTALPGPFIAPRVFVEAPVSPNMPGNAVAVAYGTNVIAAGFTNIATGLTNNLPFLLCLETTNGSLRFATNSPNSGHYNSVAVYGDKLLAVGAAYAGGNTLQCSNLIEQWSLVGGTQTLSSVTGYGVGRTGSLSQVVAIESLDRAYAVGSVTNSDNSVDAVLVEIDLQNLAIISTVTNNITNFTGVALANYGKAITTDGVDLYVAVEGPGDGNASDRQAAIFRYRAKNFYQPEETLNTFVGERTWGTSTFYTNVLGSPTNYTVTNTAWRLQIADTRAGGTNASFTTNGMVISWNLNFTYAASNTPALALAPAVNNPVVLLSTAPKYFQVKVPSAAGVATNLITASAPVRVTFNPASLPTPGAPGNVQMFSGASTGSFLVSTNTNAVARLRPGSEYYIAIQALTAGAPVDVTVRVDFDRSELPPPVTPLASGVPVNGLALRTPSLSTYTFEVPANASSAMFEITAADGDVNLYLRRSNGPSSLPTAQEFDRVSANPFSGLEQIFLVTNGASAAALTPGTWYLGVQNADNSPVAYTIRATAASATPYTIVTTGNGQTQNGVTSPGNAPNTLFKLNVPIAQNALLFEVRNLTGPGDLIVRRNAFPLATTFDGANARPDALPEIVTLRTNGALPTVAGDWYFGVLNPGAAHVAYTVMARQPTNGVLLSSSPIQILGTPGGGLLAGGTSFGFDLDVVPGEKYQVQYRTNLASGAWLVLTNIVAPADGAISFLHSGALTNRNLYYRIQVVP
ncbi:MAG: Peptidase S8 and S53 subtilisin kexin sedolisin [Limisphaerales bacterium]|nr:MAG: Peptidase S8 and S53 subtilisin kexin sedolisin [Limisphaerales bacterium]TXT48869.1 MAG: Peptidase S8 and S53 subtilisin kexin sedolisin [Limisphaerales bacterium]